MWKSQNLVVNIIIINQIILDIYYINYIIAILHIIDNINIWSVMFVLK